MEMGFIKMMLSFIRNTVVLLGVLFYIVGCGTTETSQEPVAYTPEKAKLLSTLEYIPKLRKNRQGKFLPYKPLENPYLKKKGTVDKASIEKFIQAKRAYKLGHFFGWWR